MTPLKKVFQFIYSVYALLVFVVLMVPVFLWCLLVAPLGRIRGGNLTYRGCMAWADAWFVLIGMRIRITHAPLDAGPRIYIANHSSYLDSTLIPKVFRFPIRPLGKAEMAKIPVFGFIYRNAIVAVDRSSVANRARSVQDLKSVLAKGISILVFPEGTFNTTGAPLKEFYDGAFRIAIETGTPLQPVLLPDAVNRLNPESIFSLNPGPCRAVFLPEIPVNDYTLDDVSLLKKKAFGMMWEGIDALRQKKVD